ncbi:hypothetical protein WISP_03185 [Willisornis vidua]|uniref:Uncharacterized protein n=1 Tax=Willisornis vidua TaxID=1566151 RepID=A0ABQ9DTR0_9PASS|nr:hypothetical protein WISP_03185 [Willisornis vidua]
MNSGIECTLSKFARDPKLCSVFNKLEGRDAIHTDLDNIKKWACVNLMKFNKASANPCMHGSETDRPVVSSILFLALLQNWDNICLFPVSFPGTYLASQDHSKIIKRDLCNGISQLFEDSWMNSIRFFRGLLEQQIPQKFRVNWEFIILLDMVLQFRAL